MLHLFALVSLVNLWAISAQNTFACINNPQEFGTPSPADNDGLGNDPRSCSDRCWEMGSQFSYFSQQVADQSPDACYCSNSGPPSGSYLPTNEPGGSCGGEYSSAWNAYYHDTPFQGYNCYPNLQPELLNPPLQTFGGDLGQCFQQCQNSPIFGFQPSEGGYSCFCSQYDPPFQQSSGQCQQGNWFMMRSEFGGVEPGPSVPSSSASSTSSAPASSSSAAMASSTSSAPASSSSAANCQTTGCPSGQTCALIGEGGGGYICIPSQSPAPSASMTSSAASCQTTGCPSGQTCANVGHGGGGYICVPSQSATPSASMTSSAANCQTTGCPSGQTCANIGEGGGGYICIPPQSASPTASTSASDCRSTGCPSGNTCANVGHGGGGYICVPQQGSSMMTSKSTATPTSTSTTRAKSTKSESSTTQAKSTKSKSPTTSTSTTRAKSTKSESPTTSTSTTQAKSTKSESSTTQAKSTKSKSPTTSTSAVHPTHQPSAAPSAAPSCDCCDLAAQIRNLTSMIDYLETKICNITDALSQWNGTASDWKYTKTIWGAWW